MRVVRVVGVVRAVKAEEWRGRDARRWVPVEVLGETPKPEAIPYSNGEDMLITWSYYDSFNAQ